MLAKLCMAVAPLLLSGTVLALPPDVLLDLDAEKGVTVEDGNRVSAWTNQAPGKKAHKFVQRDEGRQNPGSGRPTLRRGVAELRGKSAIVFQQQELVCMDEDSFDGLTTGKGHTWLVVLAPSRQRVGLKDVNSFFGNLRNGGNYEGIWACLDDDNTVWWGIRNGISFGRFDQNNPKLSGPKLAADKFFILAGRMSSGSEEATLELFVGGPKAVATTRVPVNPNAKPSKLAVGQERDAVEHPGHESFDGEIARLLIWERPLNDSELTELFEEVGRSYGL